MSKEKEVVLTLENLGQGAAAELFNAELDKLLDNIADPNTDPKAAREITLKVKVKPHENRRSAAVSIGATAKLAPVREQGTVVFLGKLGGKNVATESHPQQMQLGDATEHEGRTN